MRGQQQQPPLAPSEFASPFSQPFDEGIHGNFCLAGFGPVLVGCLPQQLDPRTVRLPAQPIAQVLVPHQAGVTPAERVQQSLRLAKMPDTRKLLVRHLCWDALKLAQAANGFEIAPFLGDHSAARPVPVRCERRQPLQFGHSGLRL